MPEIEAKYLIHSAETFDHVLKHLEGCGIKVEQKKTREIVDRYFDTAKWDLFRLGWACRVQEVETGFRLGIKSTGSVEGALQSRDELEQDVTYVSFRDNDLSAGPVTDWLRSSIRVKRLRELFEVRKQRSIHMVYPSDGVVIEMAFDHVVTIGGDNQAKWAPGRLEYMELELELKEGEAADIESIGDALSQSLNLSPARMSKFERGLQASGICPPPIAVPVRLSGESAVNDLVYEVLRGQFHYLRCYTPRALEGMEPEGVHQMRVVTRRMRAVLRAFQDDLSSKRWRTLNQEFRWLAGKLGEVRDLDVQLQALESDVALIDPVDAEHLESYRTHMTQLHKLCQSALVQAIDSERFRQLVRDLENVLEKGPKKSELKRSGAVTIRDRGMQLINRHIDELLRDGNAIDASSPAESLHDLRITCKRLRYVFEFFKPYFDGSLNVAIRYSKVLQDILGDFQDACMTQDRLRAYADQVWPESSGPGQFIAIGELIGVYRHKADELRQQFLTKWQTAAPRLRIQ